MRLDEIILDPKLKWEQVPAPEEHPNALIFKTNSEPWSFLVMGEVQSHNGWFALGGTAVNSEQGIIINLPLGLVKEAWDIAKAQQ